MNSLSVKELIDDAPSKRPITKLKKCENYIFENNVLYLTKPAYDAYILPVYNSEEKCFYHTKYYMDNDFEKEEMFLCELDDLRNRHDFQYILDFYGIKED